MKEIAVEILRQLGGQRRLEMMIGAYNFVFGTNKKGDTWLSFKFKASSKVNHIKITLTWDDLYSIQFGKIHGKLNTEFVVVEEVSKVDCENLIGVIEKSTGCYLRLGRPKSLAS